MHCSNRAPRIRSSVTGARLLLFIPLVALLLPIGAARTPAFAGSGTLLFPVPHADKDKPRCGGMENITFAPKEDEEDDPFDPDRDPSLRVTYLSVYARQLVLHVGESAELAPTPYDGYGKVVDDVAVSLESYNSEIVSVDKHGGVRAVGAGHTMVDVRAGLARAVVDIEVRDWAPSDPDK